MTTGAAARFFDYSRSYNFLQKVALEGGGDSAYGRVGGANRDPARNLPRGELNNLARWGRVGFDKLRDNPETFFSSASSYGDRRNYARAVGVFPRFRAGTSPFCW